MIADSMDSPMRGAVAQESAPSEAAERRSRNDAEAPLEVADRASRPTFLVALLRALSNWHT